MIQKVIVGITGATGAVYAMRLLQRLRAVGAQSHLVEITRADASRRKFYSRRTAWEILLAAAAEYKPRYASYSYARKADLYRIALTYDQGARLLAAMTGVAPTFLRNAWRSLKPPTIVTFVCPRS